MDMTIGLIYYRLLLTTDLNITLYKNLPEDFPIKNCLFFNYQQMDVSNLYISNERDILENSAKCKGHSIICITDRDDDVLSPNYDLITVKPPIDPQYLSNHIHSIFQNFRDWKDEINTIRQTTRDLNEVLTASQKLLPYAFVLVDDEFNFIGKTPDFFKRYPNYPPDRIPLEIANEFFSEEEFVNVKEHRNVFEYVAKSPTKIPEDIGLCYNIFIDGNYYARLAVEVPRKNNMYGERYFVKCLGEVITEMCSEPNSKNPYEKDYLLFHETIRLFINGHFQDRNTVRSILTICNWVPEHQYQVLKFKFDREGYILYYCRQIEKLFKNCCAVHTGDGIYCIKNISLITKEEEEIFRKQLPYFVRENLCKVGISDTFDDIFQLFTYCHEADIALELGEKIDKHFWYYHFSKYKMNYIIEQCTSILPIYNICHNGIKELKKYDEKNGTELYITLYELIKCKYNITHAAKALFIHRTTLIQRLERIKKLTGIHLDDYEECLYLMLSYYLMMQK